MQDPADPTLVLKRLFEQHHRRVFQIALHMTHSASDADDIVQEVFIKLYSGIASRGSKTGETGWIYRIAVNATLDHLRWYKRRRTREKDGILPDSLPATINPADEDLTSQDQSRKIHAALSRLKTPFRAMIILRDMEGFSYEEIAEILGISPGTVASRLHRAYCKLRNELKKSGMGDLFREGNK